MAVYTQLCAEAIDRFIGNYDVGTLLSAKGIAEGVSNSNWLIETTGGAAGWGTRFVLTLYERRIATADLPFFLALLDHLAACGCPVPRTIPARDGDTLRMIDGKAAALIQFLPGVSIARPSASLVRNVGNALAHVHVAAASFPLARPQALGLPAWHAMIGAAPPQRLATIDPALPDLLAEELAWLDGHWPDGLPQGIVHGDLFPDNVLTLGQEVSGLIDFYFAATDSLAYDVAVTHAAWCFDEDGHTCRDDLTAALLSGYEATRPLSRAERDALPVLARGAAMRFIASRALDWLEAAPSTLGQRKDPCEFIRRLGVYRRDGSAIFTREPGSGR